MYINKNNRVKNDRVLFRASYGGMKRRKFYNLLVEDTINQEELDVMRKESRRDIKELR